MPRVARPSLHAVAQAAGVAPATVSRVLNDPHKVAPKTRARIEAVMKRLGYVPDLVASSLASRRSRIVAFLVPTLSHPMVDIALQNLARVLRPAGYHVIVAESGYEAANSSSFVAALLGRRPDAIVVLGPVHEEKARRLLRQSGVFTVQIWNLPAGKAVGVAVGFRNLGAATALVEHLVARGYRRPGFFGAIDDERVRERRQAFRDVLAAHGLRSTFERVSHQYDAFYDPTGDLIEAIEQHPATDALVCDTDATAHVAMSAFQRRGWTIPQRIAVAGFGDFPVSARLFPSLTTVRVYPHRMGQRAGEIILQHLRGERVPQMLEDVGFEVMAREST